MKIVFIIVSILTTISTNGQIAEDYYIPLPGYNLATFYMPDKTTGARTELTRKIYYVQNGNNYDITDAKLFQGQPSSIITKTIQFAGDEVKMIKSVSTGLSETNKKKIFEPTQTIFKFPAKGQVATWTNQTETDGIIKFSATWATVRVNGNFQNAIKVVETIPNFSAKEVKYYVYGIGLWKVEIVSNGKAQTTDKFDELSFDPTALAKKEDVYDNSIISKYERYVINGQRPSDPNVETKYDDRDFHAIFWSDKLSNASDYSREKIERYGYEYLKITVNDRQHITYTYRNCKKNIILEVTEWYNYKISIDIQWFSNSVKRGIGFLMYCE